MFQSLPITPFGILVAAGFAIASFLFWRNLRGDYVEEEILSLTVWLGLGGLLVSRAAYAFFHYQLFWRNPGALILWTRFPGFSLTGAALGIGAILVFWGRKKELDIWPVLDQMIIAGLFLFVLGCLGGWLSDQRLIFLIKTAAGILVLALVKFFLKNYRSFTFYPSGRVGFVGLSGSAIFFSLILALDFFSKSVLLFEGIGFLVIILGSLGLLYQRSGRKLREDLGKLKIKNQIFKTG